MDQTAIRKPQCEFNRDDLEQFYDADVLDRKLQLGAGEPLYGDFLNEIEIWARRALGSNGFGDL